MHSKKHIEREFNITGLCLPEKHFMAGRSDRIKEVIRLVEKGKYFTINRPRQYGKTTVLFQVEKELDKMGCLSLSISFEGVGDEMFSSEARFAAEFIQLLYPKLELFDRSLTDSLLKEGERVNSLRSLSRWIKYMIQAIGKRVILQIDEVDNDSRNPLFLRFLAMLRAKYLDTQRGMDSTFHSVILAGVHDIKNLKIKIRPDGDHQKNSPWNIAVDFKVDLNLSPDQIAEMLTKYVDERSVSMDIPFFADKLFYLTSGYPFLVSYLCKVIDEEILPKKKEQGQDENAWEPHDLDKAMQYTLKQNNTNFDSLIGKLENNPELYDMIYKIIMNDRVFSYNQHNRVMSHALMYGIVKDENQKLVVHNRLYEQLIYNYMIANLEILDKAEFNPVSSSYILDDGSLNLKKVLLKYQQFMKEQYSAKDTGFIERNGRLLFPAFLKPIINGRGYDFKEVQTSEEKRMDVVVTYERDKFIIELKKWYGEKAHENGLQQLADYLERQDRDIGYLLIFDSRKTSNRISESDTVTVNNKKIFMVWV